MTPEQAAVLAVAGDQLREAFGGDGPIWRRVLTALDPAVDEAIAALFEEAAGHQRAGYHYLCPDCRRSYGHNSLCRSFRALQLLEKVFSPSETPVGASTSQFPAPPSNPGDQWIWREYGWVNYGPNGTPPAPGSGHEPNRPG